MTDEMKEQLEIIKSPEYKRQKSKTPEEQRLAEIRALKKERAHNNARIKAELVALGEMPTKRKPPKRPIKAEDKIDKFERDINEKLTHIIETVVRDNDGDSPNHFADLPTKADIASLAADNDQIARVGSDVADLKDALKALLLQMSRTSIEDDDSLLKAASSIGAAHSAAAMDSRQIGGAGPDVVELKDTLESLVLQVKNLNSKDDNLDAVSKAESMDESKIERVGADVADLKESMQALILQMSKPFLPDENHSVMNKVDSVIENRQFEQVSNEVASLKDTLESLVSQMKNLNSKDENLDAISKAESMDESKIERVSADVADLKESVQALILQMSKPSLPDENHSVMNKIDSTADSRQIEQVSNEVASLKDTLESLVLQVKDLNSKDENHRAMSRAESMNESKIERVGADVANLKETIQTLILQMSKPNSRDESHCFNRPVYKESMPCYHHVRTPQCMLQHAVPHQPQVSIQAAGQAGNAEMDKMRMEMSDVKDAVNSLTHSFSSYNMGKMHSAVDALKGNSHSQMNCQPQVAPVVLQPQPQPIQPQPVYFQPQAASSQPIIVNTPPQAVQQPQAQPIILNGVPPQVCTQPHENRVSLTNNHMYPKAQPQLSEYSSRSAMFQSGPDVLDGGVSHQPFIRSTIHNGASPLFGHEHIQENNVSQVSHERPQIQPMQAEQAIVKQDSASNESSGLAAMLARMSATLDELVDDMK